MDYSSRPQEQIRDHHHNHSHHQKPPPSSSYSPLNSPTSNGSTTNNGVQTPTTPKLMTPRSTDPNNPYATTFVQADSSNFKHVVQMLTGSSETSTKQTSIINNNTNINININININKDSSFSSSSSPLSKNFTIPPVKTTGAKKNQQQGFKLYERRSQNLKNSLMINTLMPNFHHRNSNNNSPRHHQILSPSVLDFPALTLSPITPLLNDEHSPMGNSSSEEDRAIAEKGFYLHPSPRSNSNNNTPREPEPRLLPLFPVTSPRVLGSTSSTS